MSRHPTDQSEEPTGLPVADWMLPGPEFEKPVGADFSTTWMKVGAGAFFVIGVAYLMMVARVSDSPDAVLATHFKATLILLVSQGVLAWLVRRSSTTIGYDTGLGLLQKKIPNDMAMPVRFDILRGGTLFGSDEGFAWIENDTFWFRGLNSAFHVPRHEIPPIALWPKRLRPKFASPGASRAIPVPEHEDESVFVVTPIDPFEDYGARRRANKWDHLLLRWMRDVPESTDGTALLPPLSLHPALQSRGSRLYFGVILSATLLLANLALVVTTPFNSARMVASPITGFIVAAGQTLCLLIWGRMLHQEWRDARNRDQFSRSL
jgi:hypothetical protein